MEWFFRLIGIGLIFGLAVWSIDYYETAVEAMMVDAGSKVAVKEHPSKPSSTADLELALSIDPPRYLNFTPGFESGNYRIADAPSSEDGDIIEPQNSSRSSSSRSTTSSRDLSLIHI